MHLKVFLPTEIVVDEPVTKVVAEGEEGAFCIEPRHVDYVAALVPGLLCYCPQPGNDDMFLAVDGGVLVKCGPALSIATRRAVRSHDLEALEHAVRREFAELDQVERTARAAIARLEAGVVRRFLQLRDVAP